MAQQKDFTFAGKFLFRATRLQRTSHSDQHSAVRQPMREYCKTMTVEYNRRCCCHRACLLWRGPDLCVPKVWAASLYFIQHLYHLLHPYGAFDTILTSPPPRLHYAQLRGSTHSTTKCPAISLPPLMISPDFIVSESCNGLMKFSKNWGSWDTASSLSPTPQCPNLCEIWAWMRHRHLHCS